MGEEGSTQETEEKTRPIDEASVQDIVRAIQDCKGHYSFLIGAGTSKAAGIPTGSELEWQWKKERYGEEHSNKNIDEVPEDTIQDWVEDFENDKGINDENTYGFWFEQRHTTRGERRHLIRQKVEDKEPTFGIIVLASLMADGYIPLTLTTNFDDLLYDALYRFLEEKPLVIDHDAVAEEFRLTKDRTTIVKLHGDYFYDNLQNTATETERLEKNMRRAISLALNEYGLIVVGYGGTDKSIMEDVLLNTHLDIPEYGVFWCGRDKDRLSNKAKQFLEQDNTYFVQIEDSESLFTKLGNRISGVNPPTAENLRSNAEKKIQILDRSVEQRGEEADTQEEEEYLDALKHISKASDFFDNEEWEKSIEKYTKALEINPEDSSAYTNRGLAYDEIDEQEKAIEDLTKALELNPEDAGAYANRSYVYGRLGEYEKALEDATKAIELNPDKKSAYLNRSFAYESLGEFEKSIKDATKALELDPEDSMAHVNRGVSYIDIAEYEKGIDDYTEAIELDPKYLLAYQNRSEAYLLMGKYRKALDDAQSAYNIAEKRGDVAVSLLFIIINKIQLGEGFSEEEKELRNICSQEIKCRFSLEKLQKWIEEETEVGEKERIQEITDHLDKHIVS